MEIKSVYIFVLFFLFYSITFSQNITSDTNAPANNQEQQNTGSSNQNQQMQNNPAQPSAPNFGMGLQFGTMTIDGTNFNSIRFQPELTFGKFGIGLDINFEFDADGNFRITEWNSWQAVLSKIMYIRYGIKGDPVYAKIGGINDFILGNGFIVNRFSNMLNYPVIKKIGLAFDLDLNRFGFEAMADNLFTFDILGIRMYGRPLLDLDVPVVKNLEIGVTVAADLDPQIPAPPADNPYDFTVSSSGQTVTVFGGDVDLPIVNIPAFTLRSYIDFAGINGKGTGEALGFGGSIVNIIPYQMEMRFIQPKFVPNYFDVYYDSERSIKYDSLDEITNGDIGWMFNTGISVFDNKLYGLLKIENSFAVDSKPMLTLTFGLSRDLIKRLGIELSWTRKNLTSFSDILYIDNENSVLSFNVDYYITENLAISINYKRSFQVDENGNVQSFNTTSVSTKINF